MIKDHYLVQCLLYIYTNNQTMKSQNKFLEICDRITREITAEMQAGRIIWQQCWSSAGLAKNYFSNRTYDGFNQLYLSWITKQKNYKAPLFLSYKQAQALGGNVKKGERSTVVVFWKIATYKKAASDEEKKVFYPFYHSVFNIDQVEGIEWELPEVVTRTNTPIEQAAAIIEKMPNRPSLIHNGTSAWYHPSLDLVNMPELGTFDSSEAYYNVLFHEHIHATGHASRLNRFEDMTEHTRFESENYSKEELTAEIGAAFLLARAGIESESLRKNSVAYLQGWISKLKEDSTLIIYAAQKAIKAANYILDTPPPADSKEEEEAMLVSAA